MADLLAEVRPGARVGVLSGPNLAGEIAAIDDLKPWAVPEAGDRAALNEWLVGLRRDNWG